MSDNELTQSICCDVRFQYALHTTSFIEQPVNDRTFSRSRECLYSYEQQTCENLLKEEMMDLAEVYQQYMNFHSNIKRVNHPCL